MAKKKESKAIESHMHSRVSSFKQGKSRDMAKGPRHFAKGEISNEVARPPKR
jgi:hypothetical protein